MILLYRDMTDEEKKLNCHCQSCVVTFGTDNSMPASTAVESAFMTGTYRYLCDEHAWKAIRDTYDITWELAQ